MKNTALTIGLILVTATAALGDWDSGDGHKMHFPQLPDPNGWDVNFTKPHILADDWMCSETGPVDDIHFWVSHRQNEIPIIWGLDVKIFANIPAGAGGANYSMPGQELWDSGVTVANVRTAPGGLGDQGWFDPVTGEANLHDHNSYFQINLTDFERPFVQQKGEIYWLGISLDVSGSDGWKSADLTKYPAPYTGQHFEDDAVYRTALGGWQELHYPSIDPEWGGRSMDLAFVITPEPCTMAMLAVGGLVLLRRRRKNR